MRATPGSKAPGRRSFSITAAKRASASHSITTMPMEKRGNRRCSSPSVPSNLNINYAHGEKGQSAMFKFEGTDGVIWVQLGVMLDYPEGRPDTVQVKLRGQDWKNLM